MRDKRYIAAHRGGTLTREHHIMLTLWACACAEKVLPLAGKIVQERLKDILQTARRWTEGKAMVGEARNASVLAHAVARGSSDPVEVAVARAAGHAAATAHMADHAVGAAIYALKAVHHADRSSEEERKRQNEIIPPEIADLVISLRTSKEKHMKIFSTTAKKQPERHG